LAVSVSELTIPIEDINKVLEAYPKEKRYSLAILQDMQRKFGYVSRESLKAVSEYLGIKFSSLYSMATFFRALSLKPKGKYVIKVCDGTACHIRGGHVVLNAIERSLGIKTGETTKDSLFSVETVNCVGV
jgi:NADH-quinone oxidoreductase subunit E